MEVSTLPCIHPYDNEWSFFFVIGTSWLLFRTLHIVTNYWHLLCCHHGWMNEIGWMDGWCLIQYQNIYILIVNGWMQFGCMHDVR
jgi:hypothetical protein